MTLEQEVLEVLKNHTTKLGAHFNTLDAARDLAVRIERSWRETGVINWEHRWDQGYAAAIAAFVMETVVALTDEGLKIRDWGEG